MIVYRQKRSETLINVLDFLKFQTNLYLTSCSKIQEHVKRTQKKGLLTVSKCSQMSSKTLKGTLDVTQEEGGGSEKIN